MLASGSSELYACNGGIHTIPFAEATALRKSRETRALLKRPSNSRRTHLSASANTPAAPRPVVTRPSDHLPDTKTLVVDG